MRVSAHFNKHDVWVGVYWQPGSAYVCILPCFPIKFERKATLAESWAPPATVATPHPAPLEGGEHQ